MRSAHRNWSEFRAAWSEIGLPGDERFADSSYVRRIIVQTSEQANFAATCPNLTTVWLSWFRGSMNHAIFRNRVMVRLNIVDGASYVIALLQQAAEIHVLNCRLPVDLAEFATRLHLLQVQHLHLDGEVASDAQALLATTANLKTLVLRDAIVGDALFTCKTSLLAVGFTLPEQHDAFGDFLSCNPQLETVTIFPNKITTTLARQIAQHPQIAFRLFVYLGRSLAPLAVTNVPTNVRELAIWPQNRGELMGMFPLLAGLKALFVSCTRLQSEDVEELVSRAKAVPRLVLINTPPHGFKVSQCGVPSFRRTSWCEFVSGPGCC